MNGKVKWLRDNLAASKLDGMIVSNPINVYYLTGLTEEGFLVLGPVENLFITDRQIY